MLGAYCSSYKVVNIISSQTQRFRHEEHTERSYHIQMSNHRWPNIGKTITFLSKDFLDHISCDFYHFKSILPTSLFFCCYKDRYLPCDNHKSSCRCRKLYCYCWRGLVCQRSATSCFPTWQLSAASVGLNKWFSTQSPNWRQILICNVLNESSFLMAGNMNKS